MSCKKRIFENAVLISEISDEYDDEEFKLYGNKIIEEIIPYAEYGYTKITYYNKLYPFGTNFARIAPFLLAYGRERTCQMMEPFINQVVRCHTDGFITNVKIDSDFLGDTIGKLKFEGHSEEIEIIHVNKILNYETFK